MYKCFSTSGYWNCSDTEDKASCALGFHGFDSVLWGLAVPLDAFQVNSHHFSPHVFSFWSQKITQIFSQTKFTVITSSSVRQMSYFSLSFHTLTRSCISLALKLWLFGFLGNSSQRHSRHLSRLPANSAGHQLHLPNILEVTPSNQKYQ